VTVAAKARKASHLARFVVQQTGRSERFRSLRTAGQMTLRHFRKILGQLWLEVTGFVFLAIAAIGAVALVREYLKLNAGTSSSGRVVLALCFTLMFGWFGLSSFLRIRRRN